MATRKPRRFDEGGSTEAADKEAGLKASQGDKVGFFERLRMGNIDQEGSEAYKRFGAGRGRAERVPVEDRTATPVMDALEEANTREPIKMEPGPRVPSAVAASSGPSTRSIAKPSAPASSNPRDREAGMTRGTRPANPRDLEAGMSRGMRGEGPPKMTMGRTPTPTTRQRVEAEIDSARPTPEQTQKGLETATAMMGGVGLKSLHQMAKNLANTGKGAGTSRTAAQQAWDRSQIAERLTPSRGMSPKAAEEAAREAKTLNPLAWIAGPKGMKENFKRGGAVKKMASGGMTSKPMASGASRRADGIATKGKTRGKIY